MEHTCRASIFFLAYFGRLTCSDVCGPIVGFEYSQRVPKQPAHHVTGITVSVWKNVANMEHVCRACIFFLAYFGRLSCSDVCGSIVGFEFSQRVPKHSAHHIWTSLSMYGRMLPLWNISVARVSTNGLFWAFIVLWHVWTHRGVRIFRESPQTTRTSCNGHHG
jgi:sulfite exporter TauE/SafE